jgi:hypothetical protein
VAILVTVLVAIMGPWTFDRIWVPSEHLCSPPTIRLDGDYCGTPLPGLWLLRWMVDGFVYASAELLAGAMAFVEWARESLFGLFLFLLVLPFFTTLLLILREDRRRWQLLTVAAWGLAAAIGLLIGIYSYPKLFWVLWGIWLYIGLAASALILEALSLAAGRRSSPG